MSDEEEWTGQAPLSISLGAVWSEADDMRASENAEPLPSKLGEQGQPETASPNILPRVHTSTGWVSPKTASGPDIFGAFV